MPFDLTLFPLNRQKGQDLASLPGLLALTPPRKTARGREQDRLVALLAINGSAPLTTADYLNLTGEIGRRFYETPGSVTSALRAAAEWINQSLLDRNLSSGGQYTVGWLVLAALRAGQLYILQCGPTHAYQLSASARHIHDPQMSGRGLGLSQTLGAYLSFVDLQPGDQVVLAVQSPPGWEAIVTDHRGPSVPDITRRRLLSIAGAELGAVLIQVQDGTGNLTVARNGESAPESGRGEGPAPVTPKPVPAPEPPPNWSNSHKVGVTRPDPAPVPSQPVESAAPPPPVARPPAQPVTPPAAAPVSFETPAPEEPVDEEPLPSDNLDEFERSPARSAFSGMASQGTRQAAKAAAGAIRGGRKIGEKMNEGVRKITPRLVPSLDSEKPLEPSNGAMLFIAILIPVLIAAAAIMIYFRFGRTGQFDEYLLQSQALVAQAQAESDPAIQRQAWEAALQRIQQAEKYTKTDESTKVHNQAQAALDEIDKIIRLDFQKAIIGLPRGAEITKMAAAGNELYLIDSQGKVLRAYLAGGRTYQYDATFQCGPGAYGNTLVGSLVDMLTISRNNTFDATLIAVDAKGNLLYCAPNKEAQLAYLEPVTEWTGITAIAHDSDNLYVLDPAARGLWIYDDTDGEYPDLPIYFFGQQVPTLEDVVDFVVNGDDLYLLHADGTLTTCTYSRLDDVPTRCVEPATLTDMRPGQASGPTLAGASFGQALLAPLPDTAIYLLDRNGHAIYRFSPRSLELQNQLRAKTSGDGALPTGTISAMTISDEHVLFFSIKDQVYAAFDVP